VTEAIQMTSTKLSFFVDEAAGKIVVKVTDERTGRLIRQIPSDEFLRVARNVRSLMGFLCDHAF
jgi:flagellar protein FlaG